MELLTSEPLPTYAEKTGCTTSYRMMDKGKARNASMVDSPKNCLTNWDRRAPITLRRPISLSRCMYRVVERLMKLTETIKSNRTPRKNMMNTLAWLLLAIGEAIWSPLRRTSRKGKMYMRAGVFSGSEKYLPIKEGNRSSRRLIFVPLGTFQNPVCLLTSQSSRISNKALLVSIDRRILNRREDVLGIFFRTPVTVTSTALLSVSTLPTGSSSAKYFSATASDTTIE